MSLKYSEFIRSRPDLYKPVASDKYCVLFRHLLIYGVVMAPEITHQKKIYELDIKKIHIL
jgi:hypothetical protein